MTLPVSFKQTNILKAVIVPYADCKLRVPLIPHVFVIPVNPDSYNESLQIQLDPRVPAGGDQTSVKYLSTVPQKLKIDFFLDGTGTIDGYFYGRNIPVLAQIEKLKLTVYNVNGTIHRTNFLKFFWGTLLFCGVLENMEINYTLFNPVGIPIRAKVSLTLISHQDREISLLKNRLSSPDLTHVKDLKAGQRLDKMTDEIYNDPNLVLQVAKANGLTSFRNVKAGTEITFPPIDKQTN
ncbi:MAG: hypothetical protein AAFZ15_11865 [Bacteroidota bacterium]